MVASLDPRFVKLTEDEADNEETMFGVLEGVMSGLSLHVKAAKYFEVLRENGLCIRSVLATVTRADLMEIGLNLGHAKVVLAALFPQVAQVVVVPPVATQKYVRTNPAPDFPPVGSTGLPAPRDLRAWMVGVYDTLRERGVPTAGLKEVQLKPKTAIRADWVDGTERDGLVKSPFYNCESYFN
jgi:hypothetical protein